MELRTGYKQTEGGVIPEDWEQVRLGELFCFKNGLNKEKEFFGYGTPIVNYMDVFSHPAIRASSLNGRVFLSKHEIKNFDVRKGDVFFTRTSETTEEIGMASVMLDDPTDTVFSGFVLRARPLNQRLDDEFKAYCFSSTLVRKQIVSKASYTTRALTNGRILAQVLLSSPPLPEQRAIAAALSDVDALLSAQDKLLAKKRDIKQAAMQQLLTGKQRLPGFSGDWEVKRMGDVAPLQRGFDLPNPQLKPGSYPVVYSNGVLNFHAEFQVRGPGVVTGRSGTIGKVSFVEQDFWPHNTSLWVTNFKGNDPKFVFFLFIKVGLERFATGSGVPTLNRNDVHAFKVSIPPSIDEQTAIATVLSDMDAELTALEQQRDKTRALKQGMLQELLTGRIRLV